MNEEYPDQPSDIAAGKTRKGVLGRLWTWAMMIVIAILLAMAAWTVRGHITTWLRGQTQPVATTPHAAGDQATLSRNQASLEARLAILEQRLVRIDIAAATAADNASRAEVLLIAFAARRQIDRGAPLGYLEVALKQRFGDAQPLAVAALLNAAHMPITRDRLAARLETLAPLLTAQSGNDGTWGRIRRDLAGMFVLHKDSATGAPEPSLRLEHARMCLNEGRIDDAIADVRLMPGAKAGESWIADAHRYADTQHALDIIETAALLPAGQGQRPAVPLPATAPASQPTNTPAL